MRKLQEFEHPGDNDEDQLQSDQQHQSHTDDEDTNDDTEQTLAKCTTQTHQQEIEPEEEEDKTTCGNGPADCGDSSPCESTTGSSSNIVIVEAHKEADNQNNKNRSISMSNQSDFDSAMSSAPQSLSPQPQSCPDSPVIWPKGRDNRTPDQVKEIDILADENDMLLQELDIAKEQIKELENEVEMVSFLLGCPIFFYYFALLPNSLTYFELFSLFSSAISTFHSLMITFHSQNSRKTRKNQVKTA